MSYLDNPLFRRMAASGGRRPLGAPQSDSLASPAPASPVRRIDPLELSARESVFRTREAAKESALRRTHGERMAGLAGFQAHLRGAAAKGQSIVGPQLDQLRRAYGLEPLGGSSTADWAAGVRQRVAQVNAQSRANQQAYDLSVLKRMQATGQQPSASFGTNDRRIAPGQEGMSPEEVAAANARRVAEQQSRYDAEVRYQQSTGSIPQGRPMSPTGPDLTGYATRNLAGQPINQPVMDRPAPAPVQAPVPGPYAGLSDEQLMAASAAMMGGPFVPGTTPAQQQGYDSAAATATVPPFMPSVQAPVAPQDTNQRIRDAQARLDASAKGGFKPWEAAGGMEAAGGAAGSEGWPQSPLEAIRADNQRRQALASRATPHAMNARLYLMGTGGPEAVISAISAEVQALPAEQRAEFVNSILAQALTGLATQPNADRIEAFRIGLSTAAAGQAAPTQTGQAAGQAVPSQASPAAGPPASPATPAVGSPEERAGAATRDMGITAPWNDAAVQLADTAISDPRFGAWVDTQIHTAMNAGQSEDAVVASVMDALRKTPGYSKLTTPQMGTSIGKGLQGYGGFQGLKVWGEQAATHTDAQVLEAVRAAVRKRIAARATGAGR